LGDCEAAIDNFTRIIETEQNDDTQLLGMSLFNRGICHRDSDNLNIALKDFERSAQLREVDHRPYLQAAEVEYDRGNLENAKNFLDKAEYLNPGEERIQNLKSKLDE